MPRREAPAHALPPDFEGLIDLLVASAVQRFGTEWPQIVNAIKTTLTPERGLVDTLPSFPSAARCEDRWRVITSHITGDKMAELPGVIEDLTTKRLATLGTAHAATSHEVAELRKVLQMQGEAAEAAAAAVAVSEVDARVGPSAVVAAPSPTLPPPPPPPPPAPPAVESASPVANPVAAAGITRTSSGQNISEGGMDDGGGDGGTRGTGRTRTAGAPEINLEGELEDKWGDLAEEEEKTTRRKADGSAAARSTRPPPPPPPPLGGDRVALLRLHRVRLAALGGSALPGPLVAQPMPGKPEPAACSHRCRRLFTMQAGCLRSCCRASRSTSARR